MSTLTPTSLQSLGQRVAAAGVDVDPQALTALATTAQAHGVTPVVVDVLLDRTAPSNVRLRAFERVTCSLTGRLQTRASVAAVA